MNTPTIPRKLFRRRPGRAAGPRRVSRRTRGSVLILVVALLVLMALIGTAWISSSRTDRTAAIQHANNSEIELLTDGVINMGKAAIVADASGNGVPRGPGYVPSDSTVTDKFLASRIPLLLDEVAPVWTAAAPTGLLDPPTYEPGRLVRVGSATSGDFYVCLQEHRADSGRAPGSAGAFWGHVGTYDLTSRDPVLNPVLWAATSDIRPPDTKFEDITGRVPDYTARTGMMPTSVNVGGKEYPAFAFYHPALGKTLNRNDLAAQPVIAADTDGDGMADANFFRLPVGRVNGVDYFAAIRIVDNNSAVNASVASFFPDPTTTPEPPAGQIATFPSDLNIGGMIVGRTAREFVDQGIRLQRAVMNSDPADELRNPPQSVTYTSYQTPVTDRGATYGPTRRDFIQPALNAGGVTHLHWMTRGRRLANPGWWIDEDGPARMKGLPSTDAGALAYRGGTLMNPDAMNLNFTGTSLIEQLLPQTIYFSADNHPNSSGTQLNTAYRYDVGRRNAYPEDQPNAWLELFVRNYDWLQRWVNPYPPQNANDFSTYLNRRSLLTVSNPVSSAVPGKLTGRDPLNGRPSVTAMPWNPHYSYDLGDVVSYNGINWVCTGPVQAGRVGASPPGRPGGLNAGDGGQDNSVGPGFPPGLVNGTWHADHPNRVRPWEPQPYTEFPTRASVNAGTFGQLYLAFWQVMAQNASLARGLYGNEYGPPLYQSPFKDAYRIQWALAGTNLDSPYYGGRFTAGVLGVGNPVFPPYVTPGTNPPVPDQHPLRGFRSTIRSVPNTAATAATPFFASTPRLMTDHTMRLRAALAAVNAIDMRDSDDDVTVKELNLGVTLNRGNDPINELETGISWATDRHVIARVKVFGHERQPFITEVYAENDNLTNGPAPANAPNPNGYVAIELYNPYPVAINIRNCKLATIDRTPGDIHVRNLTVTDPVLVPAQAPHLADAKSNMATTTDQWTIPANGFLVLENYDGGGPATPNPLPAQPPALYRPLAVAPTGLTLPQVGLVPAPAVASAHPKNYTYVPNLHTVMDKEVVLLRPLSADYPTNLTIFGQANQAALRYTERPGATQVSLAVDMAPLDSYDFTGLANPDAAVLAVSKTPFLPTRADAWHYSRAWQASSLANETEAWRFVYPGRYDGHQTLLNPAIRMPRQQGTQVAAPAGAALPGWDPSNQQKNPWELGSPNPPSTPLDPPITLVDLPVTAVQGRATYYPYEYAIQLTNTAGLLAGAAGPNPVVAATGNVFPFGAFARNGDILQIPYIGSYSIKLTAVAMPPQEVLRNVTTVATQVPDGGQADAAYHNVLELNSISMDSVFAEDGDPFNHFGVVTPATDRTTWPPEQVGRFTPTRMDLEEGGGGFVGGPPGAPNSPAPSLTVSTNPPQPPIPRFGTMNDPTRTETSGWDGFDIEIVDGPGKGQVRLVTGYSAGGAFQVFPDWEVQLQPHVSRYVLRRGSRWRYSDNTTMPPNSFRTIGNKYWASTLFDYLTVDSPQDAYFPAADPSSYVRTQLIGSMDPPLAVNPADPLKAPANTYGFMSSGGTGSLNGSNNLADQNTPYGYTGGYIQFLTGAAAGEVRKITNYTPNNRGITVAPAFTFVPVPGDRFRIFGLSSQDRVGTQGLININTAPWRVLAAIPWARTNDVPAGVNVRLVNNTIAQGIARYRDGDPAAGIAPHGPFRSIFDLYKVPEFSFYQNQILAGQDPTGQQGDFMPVATQVDNVRLDYEEQYLLLNRVSNMLTTRSDSFTVYVLVQGWRGAGTPTPELVVQRRRAFTADRSGLSPTNKDLTTQFFYND